MKDICDKTVAPVRVIMAQWKYILVQRWIDFKHSIMVLREVVCVNLVVKALFVYFEGL
jgi:hypothetical protein